MLRWPFVLRSSYERQIKELDGRLKDVERHFVTRRDHSGLAVETLADVPFSERSKKINPIRGLNWSQQKRYLEKTDGGRER